MFQDLPSRIDRSDVNRAPRRRRKFHPVMVERLVLGNKSPITGVRIGLSLLRERRGLPLSTGTFTNGRARICSRRR
jgi:hypothetical protein